MANDVIKNFDAEVTKQEELAKSTEVVETTEVVEETVKSTEDTTEQTEVVEDATKSTEGTEITEKTEEVSKSEKPEDENEVDKSTEKDEDCDDKDVEKSDETEKPEDEVEKAEKSVETETESLIKSEPVIDFEALLEVVIKSYAQLASQVTSLTEQVGTVISTQETISKSLEDSKVTPIQESLAKSIETGVEEVSEKAVGFVEKSSIIDDEAEELSKSNVETATNEPIEFTEVETMFKSKFKEASSAIKSARDENELKEISKSWQRYINDRATSTDTDRINNFLNK